MQILYVHKPIHSENSLGTKSKKVSFPIFIQHVIVCSVASIGKRCDGLGQRNNDDSISVACYEESEKEKRIYIHNFLNNEGVKVSESLINLLSNYY